MKSTAPPPKIGRLLLAALALLAAGNASAAETVDLRGYGPVSATITPQRSEFVCASPDKADLLLGKLLADLFWDAGPEHVTASVKLAGHDAVVHIWPPYGALIAGRSGNRVVVVGDADQAEAVARAGREPALTAAGAVFAPAKAYPKYLDFYDLRSINCTNSGVMNNMRFTEGTDFVKRFFSGGVFAGVTFARSAAEGVDAGDSWLDTDLHAMERNDQTYYMAISTGEWPDWALQKWPGGGEQGSPVHFSGPLGAEAFGLSSDQRRQTSLRFFHDALRRAQQSPALAGYELYCGDYIWETYFSKTYQGHYGYTAVGLAAWRRWLREGRGLSLTALGSRWYGDPGHFKSWEDVPLPDPDTFFGAYDAACLALNEGWYWKKADLSQLSPPADDAPGWVPVSVPPSQEMTALPPGAAYWRLSFDPSAWLAKHAGQDVYLICNPDIEGWNHANVWLNGVNLGQHESKVDPYFGPFGLKLTGLLQPGANELVLQVPHGGLLLGPTFLTTTLPHAYPYLGKQANARYVDCLDWRLAALNFKIADVMAYARSLDPDRPFVLPASGQPNKDGQGESLRRYGGSMQDTGYEASFRPYDSRLGYAAGFYGSAEQSGIHGIEDPASFVHQFDRRLGWMLFNGEGMYKELSDASFYFNLEKKTGWFTNNHRKYQLFGKYLPAQPDLAILDDCESGMLVPGGDWDLGRGEVEASHYDNVYVTESMLADGLADDYAALYDENNHYLSPETLAAIRRYVEKGGTFIALQDTGRNSLLEPDTWPISDLTGFKVLSTGKQGTITFGKNLPIFKGWEGKQFAGEGSALDWKEDQSAVGVSVALAPAAAGTVALARWEDGTVAIGMRQLGKGRVLVLGSTFWRYGRDLGGTGMWRTDHVEPAFLERLFTDLGVKRTADANTPDVYTRKVITKNGLQEWLVAFNTLGKDTTADLSLAVAQQPAQVWDMNTKTPVDFTYADGWVQLKNVTLPPFGTVIYGVQRASLSAGLDEWWMEKTKFWTRRAPLTPAVEPRPDPANPPTISFENWRFLADQDGSVSKTTDWAAPAFADAAWRSADNEPWNLLFDDLKDYGGVGLYRSRPFSLPAGWKNRPLILHVDGGLGYVSTGCTAYVNGQKLPALRRRQDVTALLQPTGNVFCLQLTGKKPGGDWPLSGLVGCAFWLQPEITLAPTMSLLGDWTSFAGDWTTTQPVTLPGTDLKLTDGGNMKPGLNPVLTNHLVRDVDIPAAWRGQQVYLHAITPQMNTVWPLTRVQFSGLTGGVLFINGHAIPLDSHPNQPLDQLLNVTQYVKFGQSNRLELWPRDPAHGSMAQVNLVVNDLALGCGPPA